MINDTRIAVIGMACWYPGARDIRQFWENALARRQEFRRFPDCRLPLSQYLDPTGKDPDKSYVDRAAFIDGFKFDWVERWVPKSTFESSDIVHWLALEVAFKVIADAGYTKDSIPGENTGFILGNTLTGEQSRSLFYQRVRWPVVERSLVAAARARGLSGPVIEELASAMEQYYKSLFVAANEDSLPGNMSNTIAGRVSNHLNLRGGGYTVDCACASSLIAITTAARYLVNREMDLVLAGGVDISLDVFEMVGFSRLGAITRDEMRVYDRRADGFLPGEGCGMVVLKRLEDARRDGDYVYAVINGWGISSDGKGSITAPGKEGQALAIRRAYEHAGYSPREIAFIEGHGTGTTAGDPVELVALGENLSLDSGAEPKSCGLTSVKTIIGHTKAAAGVAGFIKTVSAVNRRVLPPIAGIRDPNPLFDTIARALYPIREGEIRDPSEQLRAGVQAMGFGGINCHITIESADPPSKKLTPAIEERALLVSNQLTEVFILGADSVAELSIRLDRLRAEAADISYGEMTDLAAWLAREADSNSRVRAAVVAGTPAHLVEQLTRLEKVLRDNPPAEGSIYSGALRDNWIANAADKPRVGFLFPGQGSQKLNTARLLYERYPWVRDRVHEIDEWLETVGEEPVSKWVFRSLDRAGREQAEEWSRELARTEIAHQAIVPTSVIWHQYLTEKLGIRPALVAGHSLGELTAFYVAGAFDGKALVQMTALRGHAMAANDGSAGTMAALACSAEKVEQILGQVSGYAVVANINGPSQTVISGDPEAVAAAMRLAETEELRCRRLPVSNAFHSRYMTGAAEVLRTKAPIPEELAHTDVRIFSGVTAEQVLPGLKLREYFADQALSKVNFLGMVRAMAQECDLFLEVGPGRVLSGLTNDILEAERERNSNGQSASLCLPVEPQPGDDRDFNQILAALFAHGVPVNWDAVYENRLVRPYLPPSEKLFIDNPCERPFPISEKDIQATLQGIDIAAKPASDRPDSAAITQAPATETPPTAPQSAADILSELIEKRTGFPRDSIDSEMRLLDDLNLDSIKAAELIGNAARRMNVAGRIDTMKSANITLRQVAESLEKLKGDSGGSETEPGPARPTWVRNFGVEYPAKPLSPPSAEQLKSEWAGARVLILHEPGEEDIADALERELSGLGAEPHREHYEQARTHGPRLGTRSDFAEPKSGLPVRDRTQTGMSRVRYSHIIPVLQRKPDPDTDIRASVERLQATVPAAGTAPAAPVRVAYVQFGGGDFGGVYTGKSEPAAINQCCTVALAATLYLEQPDNKVRVIDFPPGVKPNQLAEKVVVELTTAPGYAAVGYDSSLQRRIPHARVHQPALYQDRNMTWSEDDVVLFTGGAKGIGAECALGLARKTGVRLALVGSSPRPDDPDNEINRTLARFQADGLTAVYYRCDIADPAAVKRLVKIVAEQQGLITGVVHGAAINIPRSLDRVTAQEALAEIAPKLLGTQNLCRALVDAPPRLFVGLTSASGVAGTLRNGWYSFSNEALGLVLDRFRADHPDTRVLTIAYSLWTETGMGVRVGTVRHAADIGLGGISTSEGVSRFLRLFEADPGTRNVIVTGPLGARADTTWPIEIRPIPEGLRFLEQPRTNEPGVAAVFRTRLTLDRDPYLKDHNYKGSLLLATVFSLEAMAQVAFYAAGIPFPFETDAPRLRLKIADIRLDRPIVVDPDKGLNIEIRAELQELETADAPAKITTAIATESDEYKTDCVSATYVMNPAPGSGITETDFRKSEGDSQPGIPIDPKRDLYGRFLFQGPMFQRIEQIKSLASRRCVFRASYQSSGLGLGRLVLSDPFFLDALFHVPQILIPQDVSLPIHLAAVEYDLPRDLPSGLLPGIATLDNRDGKDITSTVTACENEGNVIIKLTRYTVRALEHHPEDPTVEELTDPGKRDERLLTETALRLGTEFGLQSPVLAVERIPGIHDLKKQQRRQLELPLFRRTLAMLGIENASVTWLASGKPVLEGSNPDDIGVSDSHEQDNCLVVAGIGPMGCDLAVISPRGREDWHALLGNEQQPLLQQLLASGDPLDVAGTRVWSARETARKAFDSTEFKVSYDRRSGSTVLFTANTAGRNLTLATIPVRLTLGPDQLFAFTFTSGQ